jgi:hypothetical protein
MVWDLPQRRTTLDIDFLARYENQIAKIESVIKEVCAVPVVADGLVFDPKTVAGRRIKEDADYEGVRIKFIGLLERSRISMQVDVGFGDVIYPGSRALDYPIILDLPQPHIKGYPIESVVSEKFEAMIKLGALNSRMKDFYDIWLISRLFSFDGNVLRNALENTFERRRTAFPAATPFAFTSVFYEDHQKLVQWRGFIKKSKPDIPVGDLSAVIAEISEFIMPVINSLQSHAPFEGVWLPDQGWKGREILY